MVESATIVAAADVMEVAVIWPPSMLRSSPVIEAHNVASEDSERRLV